MSRHRFSRARRAGFTIVELAIVLAAIGILLTGILKGQELINGAKIRAIADRQNSIRIAWFEFVDHYGAKPGDFARADEFIANVTPTPSPLPATRGNGLVEQGESDLAVEHLTLAGLLRCQQCVGDPPGEPARSDTSLPTANNSPTNQYDGVISIWHNGPQDPAHLGSPYYAIHSADTSPVRPNRLQIHTGPRIPSNILAEVDRKIDDGLANSGDMVFNQYDPTDLTGTSTSPKPEVCMNATPTSDTDDGMLNATDVMYYRVASQSVEGNCGAGIFIWR